MSFVDGRDYRLEATKKILLNKNNMKDRISVSKTSPKLEFRVFKNQWIEEFPWLEKGPTDTSHARCTYCDHFLPLKRYIFLSHEATAKHKRKVPTENVKKTTSDDLVKNSLEIKFYEGNQDPLPDQGKTEKIELFDCKKEPKEARRSYQNYWDEEFPWLERGLTDISRAKCIYCDITLPLKRYAFIAHQATMKHQKRIPNTIKKVDDQDSSLSKEKLIKKLKKEFPWLDEDPTDESRFRCVYCKYSLSMKRNALLKHQTSTLHADKFVDEFNESYSSEASSSKLNNSEVIQDSTANTEFTTFRVTTPCTEEVASEEPVKKKSKLMEELTSNTTKKDSQKFNYSYCIIKSNSKILGLATPTTTQNKEKDFSDYEIGKLVSDVKCRFSIDLKHLLNKNVKLQNYIARNSGLRKGTQGISRLKKILVGHLAQQYLSESTIALWKHYGPSSSDQNNLNKKLEEVKLKLEKSVYEIEQLKAQLQEKEKIESIPHNILPN